MNVIDEYLLDKSLMSKTLAILIVFSIIMTLSSVFWQELANTPIGDYAESGSQDIQQAAESFSGIRYLIIPLYIFIRNSIVSIISGVLGVTIIVPISIIVTNAMIIGYVIYDAIMSGLHIEIGAPSMLITAALVPHGSIELPAIAISASVALYLIDILRSRRVDLARVIKRNLILSLTMLVFAALIEAFITPLIAIFTIVIHSVIGVG